MIIIDLLKGYVPPSQYFSPGFSVEEIFGKLESLKVSLVLSPFNIMKLQPSAGEREREILLYQKLWRLSH